MSNNFQKTLLVVLIIASSICCFIGIGAFLQLAIVTVDAQEQEKAEKLEVREEATTSVEELKNEITNLLSQIENLDEETERLRNEAATAREVQAAINQLQEQKEELQRRLESCRERLAELESATRAASSEIESEQRHITAIQEQLAQRESEAEQTQQQIDTLNVADPDELRRTLSQKEQEFSTAQEEWNQLNSEWADKMWMVDNPDLIWQPKMPVEQSEWGAPVPLYIECDEEGILLHPEKTRLSLTPSFSEKTRFLSAAREVGYVIFLVRPTGFESFDNYRDVIKNSSNANFDYGYEPVNGNWHLALD